MRLSALLRILALFAVLPPWPARAQQEAKPFQTGQDLPGAFQVLVVTGERTGRFHCPVCEYDQNPGVLVFTREGAEPSAPVQDLLKKLDAAIARHPQARIGACAVFLSDGGYRQALEGKLENVPKTTDEPLAKAIVSKQQQETRLRDLAKKLGLKNLTLALGSKEGPANYKIPADADVTVLAFSKQRVVGYYSFPKGKLSDKDVEQTLQQVDKMAGDVLRPVAQKK